MYATQMHAGFGPDDDADYPDDDATDLETVEPVIVEPVLPAPVGLHEGRRLAALARRSAKLRESCQ